MIISRTPLRVSLFGGGTDFADYYRNSKYGYGAVISTSINLYVYITVNKMFDDTIRVGYSTSEYVKSVDEIKHNIVREGLRVVGIDTGIDIVYMADIPMGHAGIGLASSSAIAVGVLNSLYAYKGIGASAELLAKGACEIEIDRLKSPIGKQDQYAVAFGGLRRYQFNADDTVFDDAVICKKETRDELRNNLMYFYTGKTRQSSEVLTEQKANIRDRMAYLDSLVEIEETANKDIESNDLSNIGKMLDDAWSLKRKMASNVSNEEIDDMYMRAKAAGAEGGKILGAGGGGFLMLYVTDDYKESVRNALSDYREVDIDFEPQGSKIIYVSE